MLDHRLLPDIPSARLPAAYESAKRALDTCYSIDECKDWVDKAAALASYAKQADDDELENMAMRIRGRASRRCGQLLKEIEAAKNQYGKSARVVDHPSTRTQAAQEAGMSEHQKKTALRLASIPEDMFEEAIEADTPPTITSLAEQGTQKKEEPFDYLAGRDPADHLAWTPIGGALSYFLKEVRVGQFESGIRGATLRERGQALQQIIDIRQRLTLLETSLSDSISKEKHRAA